ncbi:hypothetical protein KO361_04325 [Candidatus Woesearchaeota archaeon]|nr:hypothetical protein [Candidatus Woesearchaeota archaeon]
MSSKNLKFGKSIFLISILCLIILTGCEQQKELDYFAESLENINNQMDVYLSNINTDLYNYNLNHGFDRLVNLAFITNTYLTNMKNIENELKKDMNSFEELTSVFLNAESESNLNKLSESQKIILDEIHSKIDDYADNKNKLEDCLNNMNSYHIWTELIKEKISLQEKYENEEALTVLNVENEKYYEALKKLDESQKTLRDLKQVEIKINNTGIQKYSKEELQEYDQLIEIEEIYRELIMLLLQEKYYEAELKNEEYLKKYYDFITNTPSFSHSIYTELDSIENWYSENIGVCLKIFEKYYKR